MGVTRHHLLCALAVVLRCIGALLATALAIAFGLVVYVLAARWYARVAERGIEETLAFFVGIGCVLLGCFVVAGLISAIGWAWDYQCKPREPSPFDEYRHG